MRRLLKRFYKNTWVGHVLIYPIKKLTDFFYFHFIPEEAVTKWEFKKAFGYKLDLENPLTLNEKIQWLKLNDRTPLHTKCADKYAVREYVKDVIGDQYLVPLFFQTFNPKDIRPENMPDCPVIIKTNHDSTGGIIIRDKTTIDWKNIQKILRKRLRGNYYYPTKEWPYKNIKPCIIVEKLLSDERGEIPFDYKLHCFHQKVEMIQVDMDRGTSHHNRNWYNAKWEREPYKWSSFKDGKWTDPRDTDVDKPKSLDKMIALSERLSKEFNYVRVDWYNINGELFFGELTFSHDGGFSPIVPNEWDRYFGDKLRLPAKDRTSENIFNVTVSEAI
jgi:hypothetical protein